MNELGVTAIPKAGKWVNIEGNLPRRHLLLLLLVLSLPYEPRRVLASNIVPAPEAAGELHWRHVFAMGI